MIMSSSVFTRGEGIIRSSFEYGLYPYEPDSPCKILSSSVEYRCDCGFRTHSAATIFKHCTEYHRAKQLSLFDVG